MHLIESESLKRVHNDQFIRDFTASEMPKGLCLGGGSQGYLEILKFEILKDPPPVVIVVVVAVVLVVVVVVVVVVAITQFGRTFPGIDLYLRDEHPANVLRFIQLGNTWTAHPSHLAFQTNGTCPHCGKRQADELHLFWQC